ncbi:MAG: hypothetical protein V4651_05055, partial [Bacteroidota bacterium]
MIIGLLWSILTVLTILLFGLIINSVFLKEKDTYRIFIVGIIGYNALCSLLHFFIPLTYVVLISTLLISALIVWIQFKKSEPMQFSGKWKFVLTIALIIVFAFYMIGRVAHWDAYLYYNQTIRWFQHYPLIKGIANLYPKIGFNFNSFTLIATTVLPHKPAFYVFNYILLLFLVSYILDKLILGKDKYAALCGSIFLVLSIAFLKVNISGPAPDFTIYILTAYLAIELFLEKELTPRQSRFFILIALYLMTVKLSIFPVSLIVFYLFRKSFIKEFKFIIGAGVFIPGVWLVRGILMTGQIIYPFPAFYSNLLSWSVDQKQVMIEYLSIIGSGRSPKINLLQSANESFAEWFPNWFKLQWSGRVHIIGDTGMIQINLIHFVMYLTVLVVIIVVSIYKRKRLFEGLKNMQVRWIAGLVLSLSYWLFTAPDFRYVAAIFYALFLFVHLLFYKHIQNRVYRITVTSILVIALFMRVSGLVYTFVY